MANTLTTLMNKILAQGLLSFRKQTMMPLLVNSEYSLTPQQKGSTISVDIPGTMTAVDITPSSAPVSATNVTTSSVDITLDNWMGNPPFALNDQELTRIEADKQFLPKRLEEGISCIVRAVNLSLLNKYKESSFGVYGWYGTAGTTPFGSGVGVHSATYGRAVLNAQDCPLDNRRAILDVNAEAAMLSLDQFANVNEVGSDQPKIKGVIGEKYGIDWYRDAQTLTHTAGTLVDAAAAKTCAINKVGGYAAGLDTIDVDEGAATSAVGTIVVGDIITFAGHTQTYTIVANASSAQYAAVADETIGKYTFATNDVADLKFYPVLQEAVVDGEVITVKGTHVVNMIFHRDAFAFASAPLADNSSKYVAAGTNIVSMKDPATGLVLRLEHVRQNKQNLWQFDMLWGAKLIYPNLAMRLVG